MSDLGWHSLLHILVRSSAQVHTLLCSPPVRGHVEALDTSLQLAAYSLRMLGHGQGLQSLRDLWANVDQPLRVRVLRSAILAVDFANQVTDGISQPDLAGLPRCTAYRAAWEAFLHDHFCFIMDTPLDCASFLLGLVETLFRTTTEGTDTASTAEIPIYLFGEHVPDVRLTSSLLQLLDGEINVLCFPEFWSQLCKFVHGSTSADLKPKLARLLHVGNILLSLVTSVGVWVAQPKPAPDTSGAGRTSGGGRGSLVWNRGYKSVLLQALMNMQRSLFGAMQHTLLSDDAATANRWQTVLSRLSSRFFAQLAVFLQTQDLSTVGQMLAVAMIWIFNVQQLHYFFRAHFFRDAQLCSSILQLLLVIKASASDRLMDAQCSLADVLSHTAVEAILATLQPWEPTSLLPGLQAAGTKADHSHGGGGGGGGPGVLGAVSRILSLSSSFVTDTTRRAAGHCANLWCYNPLFAGGLHPEHLQQCLVQAQRSQSPKTSQRKSKAADTSTASATHKDPIALMLEAIEADSGAPNSAQIASTQLAHAKLALKVARLSLSQATTANDSPGVALTLLRGAQDQVAIPSVDMKHILRHKVLASAVTHVFACLLIHAVEDPLASSYKLMMKSGTVAPGTANLLGVAIAFGLRLLRETAKASGAVQIQQAKAAQQAAGALHSRTRGLLARSQSDTSMTLRDRLSKKPPG